MRGDIKVCNDCGRPLPLEAFATNKKWKRNTCTKCRNIRERYGITGADFYEMLKNQLYSCLICEEPIDELTARIDHCHDDNQVRALLCNGCNTGIGHLKHDKEVAARAVEYLTKFT